MQEHQLRRFLCLIEKWPRNSLRQVERPAKIICRAILSVKFSCRRDRVTVKPLTILMLTPSSEIASGVHIAKRL